MQLSEWVRLFSNMPPEAQDGVILGVANGSTVAIQDVVRVDPEYVIVRGRLGGTTDSGRIFCLPYDQLTFFLFNKQLSEEQLAKTFGGEIKVLQDSLLDEEQPDRPALEEEPEVEQPQATPEPVAATVVEPPPKAAPDLRARLGLGRPSRSRPPLK